ncbi:MAG TPA: ABC transporter ATP-binding protein [Chromatiales bacterium]|nr:ABC transporter ATP-binding protein [Chromatiales bacterium]
MPVSAMAVAAAESPATGPEPPVLLEAVTKHYGDRPVVHDLSLTVRPGESLVLVGHNGAGKTTLMKLILGLTRPTSGYIRSLGIDPAARSAAGVRGMIGYLPESVAFHEAMTGREVLRFYARLKGEPVGHCERLLDRVGLGGARNRRVSTYSKGMRQRLGLAQAMLGHPRLLLLDEPTTGLDPALRRYFYEIITELRDAGSTVLISSHALHEVEARADRIAIMRQGTLVAHGTLEELTARVRLPLRVFVRVERGRGLELAKRLGGDLHVQHADANSIEIRCLGTEKMAILRRMAALGEVVRDIDIVPPRLDDVYMHYMAGIQPQ